MSLTAQGELDLAKLAPLLETQVDAIYGQLALDGKITGTFAKPSYQLTLAVDKHAVGVRPVGADAELEVAQGSKLQLANGTLQLLGVTVDVKDQQGGTLGELALQGGIGLDSFVPTQWDVQVSGQVAGKLLQLLAPEKVAQASGVASIDVPIVISGKGKWPRVTGALAFGPGPDGTAPMVLSPRGVRRDLALVDGRLEIKTDDDGTHRAYTLTIPDDHPVTVTVDGEGRFDDIRGQIVVRDNTLDHARLVLDAENVPYRAPNNNLDLTIAANDVELAYVDNAWHVHTLAPGGYISIVNGTFRRNFELAEAIKPAPATVAPAKTLWDDYPAIGNADLDLKLDVRRFSVDDNIAKIDFEGAGITISGSPRDPRLQGSIRVGARGEFTIPATRAHFTRTTGSIDFSPVERATNPALNITSDAPDYTDLSGQSHTITMAITGTLEQPLWDLHTNTGLDKSQTISLLFLGRSPEQLRRSLGDQSLGADPTRVDPSTNPSTGVSDQLVKDLAGDWVSGLFAQSLANKLKSANLSLDVLRFELGFGTIGVHAEIKALQNLKLIGDAELTVNGTTLNPKVVVTTPYHSPLGPLCHACRLTLDDRLSLQFAYLSKLYNDPADQALDITDYQGKLVYRLFIP